MKMKIRQARKIMSKIRSLPMDQQIPGYRRRTTQLALGRVLSWRLRNISTTRILRWREALILRFMTKGGSYGRT